LAHPKVPAVVKQRLREQYRTLDPVPLLAEIRAAQEELGNRVDRRTGKDVTLKLIQSAAPDAVAFAWHDGQRWRSACDASATQATL
jgi:hypothetical protein